MWNKKLYWMQLRRAFGVSFWIACGISSVLVIMQTISVRTPIWPENISYPVSIFNQWIGGESYSYASSLFYVFLPLIAMLPFGVQYLVDQKNGYLKHLALRVPATQVVLSYQICNFLVAFTASLIPFLLSLYICSMQYPALRPQAVTHTFSSGYGSMLSGLFYTKPFGYCILYSVLIAVYQALLASVGMGLSFFMKNTFLCLLCPLLLNFFSSYVAMKLGLGSLAPLYVFQPTQVIPAKPIVVIGWYLACIGVVWILWKRYVKEYEIY